MPGKSGLCGVRENKGDTVSLSTYGIISGYAVDPVEKKPLYHFFPGKNILSVGSYGCNLKCDFCQNHQISQHTERDGSYRLSPGELVSRALKIGDNIGLAFTYNEPVIWHEYVLDCARLAREHGLKNVMVTNGFVNPGPLDELLEVIDAFNIDLKGFDDRFYRRFTGGALRPVLETIEKVAGAGRHLELTTLILPGLNDSDASMHREAEWIASSAGRRVPLHISRYFPMFLRSDPATPGETVIRLRDIASAYLDFVYTGNMPAEQCGCDTYCPACHMPVIKRAGYRTTVTALDKEGRCVNCGEKITDYLRH
jgi:pyruvate formate lyase activating enzyme